MAGLYTCQAIQSEYIIMASNIVVQQIFSTRRGSWYCTRLPATVARWPKVPKKIPIQYFNPTVSQEAVVGECEPVIWMRSLL